MSSPNLSPSQTAESALLAGYEAMRAADLTVAYRRLTEAHVLGQPFASLHVRAHLAMLRYAWAKRDSREIRGQLIRLVLAGPSSVLGVAPPGNIGWAGVSMFKRMDPGAPTDTKGPNQ